MFYLLKYRKAAALLLLLGGLVWWHVSVVDDAYQQGRKAAYAEVSARLAEAAKKQAEKTLQLERKQAADFAAKQTELEKEKQHAETVITDLRRELGRVQQYAQNHGSGRKLPAANQTAAAPDETAAKGWQLFGECTAEYAGMAEIADRQRNDLAEWQAYGETVSETAQ